MRIHTGEKPYICEVSASIRLISEYCFDNIWIYFRQVCSKAFARRDKLVIHMNKFKHVTPTNIAPLGKRLNNIQAGKQCITLIYIV